MDNQSMGWQEEILAQLQAGAISLETAEQLLLREQPDNDSVAPAALVTPDKTDIAIIGIACRFPGAEDWRALWKNLQQGVDSIVDLPSGRWPEEGWYHPDPSHPHTAYLRCGGFLPHVDRFDGPFFQITPAEAAVMDPQQRIFLEEAYHAFEDAGYAPEQLKGKACGVFVGVGQSGYTQILADGGMLTSRFAITGLDSSILAARIAYFLDLQGPALAIDTACSSSLTAIHKACESIRAGESALALAGGISLFLSPIGYIQTSQFQMLSPAGRCKTFDAAAAGFVPGEGCGVVLLKNAAQALADHDHIYAVIKGSAMNQDGSTNGITAPSVRSQTRLEKGLYEKLAINPATIGYIEAHGTGTALGDPIEIEALTAAFAPFTQQKQFCAIGSIKTNIGHTLMAAGVAGVIKAALSLKFGQLLPSLHFRQPNPHIHFPNTPFYVSTTHQPWPRPTDHPRRAATSSFGMSGTNVHLVLEEAPMSSRRPNQLERPYHLFTLSAQNPAVLTAYAQRYADFLATQPDVALGDLTYTTHVGRSHFAYRLSFVADSVATLQAQLAAYRPATGATTASGEPLAKRPPKVAFLFTGQGAQSINMGRELYETAPLFRRTLARCDELFQLHLGTSILALLYPGQSPVAVEQVADLDDTTYTQPALFALEVALATLWRAWGIQPAFLLGHSIGELAAACVAGVFSLEDGVKLVAARARLMGALPPGGAMISLLTDEACVHAALAAYVQGAAANDITIAAVNGPEHVVISGQRAAVAAIAAQLAAEGVKTRPLTVSHAFHSPLMAPMLAAFRQVAATITYQQPTLPLISNLTGKVAGAEIATPDYWVRHVRDAVRFADGVATLHEQQVECFLEIGPKPVLLGMAEPVISRRAQDGQAPPRFLPSLRAGRSDWQQLLESLGTLYQQGAAIDWRSFDQDYVRRKIGAPTYPFAPQRCWVDPLKAPQQRKTLRPLIDQMTRSPVLKEILFETEFSLAALPFLTDHRIFGTVVSPAACQVAMLLSAAELAFAQATCQLLDLVFPQPLTIGADETRTVQTILTPLAVNDPYTQATVQIISFAENHRVMTGAMTGAMATHLTGALRRTPLHEIAQQPAVPLLREIQARCTTPVALPFADATSTMTEQPIHFGPLFRWLAAIWRPTAQSDLANDAEERIELLGRLGRPAAGASLAGYLLDPGLLDGCFQLAGLAQQLSTSRTELYVPFAVNTVALHQTAVGDSWWCHVEQRDALTWDLRLFTDDGIPIATITGFQLRALPAFALHAEGPRTDWLYTLDWQPTPQRDPIRPAAPVDCLVICGGSAAIGRALAAATGIATILVTPTCATPPTPLSVLPAPAEMTRLCLDPTEPAAFHALFAALSARYASLALLYLWGLEEWSLGDELPQQSLQLCAGLLHLVQAATASPSQARLWVATAGCQAPLGPAAAQATTTPLHSAALAASSLWGLGRTIGREYPDLACTCVDFVNCTEAQLITALQQEVLSAGPMAQPMTAAPHAAPLARQLAYQQGECYQARLIPWQPPVSAESLPMATLSAAALYLITGGLGALGLETAEQLVAHGARQLVLSGRRTAVSTETAARLRTWEMQGVQVHLISADMGCRADVERLLTACQAIAPLRGIIHAAGLVDDGLLHSQRIERFAGVMAAKVQGAWWLHTLTQTISLDFFLCFSSVAALLGAPGQSNYAAANAFLDTLMQQRRQAGLPGLSINWGPWAEIGMAARLSAAIQQQGMGLITPQAGKRLLRYFLDQILCPAADLTLPAQLGVLSFPKQTSSRQPQPRFDRQAYGALPAVGRRTMVTTILRSLSRTIGGFADEQLDEQQSLLVIGFDSLMAVEFRNQITQTFALTLPLSLFLDGGTLVALAQAVVDQLEAVDLTSDHPGMERDTMNELAHPIVAQHSPALPATGYEHIEVEI